MTTNMLEFGRDVQGYNAYAPLDASIKYSATLTDGTATSITIPASYAVWVVAFSIQPGTNVYVDFSGATAAAPTSGTLTATTASLNPGQRTVFASGEISVITDNASAVVGIELWPVSYP
jgi:hypothetical protein